MNNPSSGEILLDALLIFICGILCLYICRKYVLERKIVSVRFRVFVTRDKLAMLAVKGFVPEEDPAYQHLLALSNNLIAGCCHLDFAMLSKVVIKMSASESDLKLKDLMSCIHERRELLEIYVELLESTLDAFYTNSLMIRLALRVSRAVKSRRGKRLASSVDIIEQSIRQSRAEWPGMLPA